MNFPNRIICLTEETTEILYELGAEDLIVGISGYTVRPVSYTHLTLPTNREV